MFLNYRHFNTPFLLLDVGQVFAFFGRKREDEFFENEHEDDYRDDGIAENCLDESWSLSPGFVGKQVKAKTQKDGEADQCLLATTKCRRGVQDACANSDHGRCDTK